MGDLEVVATSELGKVISKYQDNADKVETLLPAISELLISAVSDVFEAQGPGWAPLAESTLKARRNKNKDSARILRDTGVMIGSLAGQYGWPYAEAVLGASYAYFHVTGTEHMPRRDPTDLGPGEQPLLDEVSDLILAHLTK